MNTAIIRCGCGRPYSRAAWSALEYVGAQEAPEGPGGEPAFRCEMRHCLCGSTISVETELFDATHLARVLV